MLCICGSDQIWNPKSIDFSEEYFLPHYIGRKIAYAPSFGNAKLLILVIKQNIFHKK